MSVKGSELRTLARLAYKRLSSGFWQEEKLRRKTTLTILRSQGADTNAAKKFLVDHTKQQLAAVINPEEEFEFWVKADCAGKPSVAELWQDQLWKQELLNKVADEITK